MKPFHFKTGVFNRPDATITVRTFPNGSLAWLLDDVKLTVALAVKPKRGCVFVKNYSECAGVLEELKRHGIVEETGTVYLSGFAHIPECRVLLPELLRVDEFGGFGNGHYFDNLDEAELDFAERVLNHR